MRQFLSLLFFFFFSFLLKSHEKMVRALINHSHVVALCNNVSDTDLRKARAHQSFSEISKHR